MFQKKFKIELIHTESYSHKIISLALWEKRQTAYKKILFGQKMFQQFMGETGLSDSIKITVLIKMDEFYFWQKSMFGCYGWKYLLWTV